MSFFTDENYENLFINIENPPLYEVGDSVSGKYIVTEILSGGQNSDVYKATDTLGNNEVVIKYVSGNAFAEETSKIQNYAADELKKWCSIPCHEGIVPVCDGFFDMRNGKFAIVSPFIESTHPMGLTLAELMENGYKFNMTDVEFLIFEIYTTITDIQKMSGELYIHKDIRPENIFIAAPENSSKFTDCRIMLADCGSYSSYKDYLPTEFQTLAPSAKDVYMLINTAKKMCKKFTGRLAVFCESLNSQSSILDFENYFGDAKTCPQKTSRDITQKLIISYNGFTFAKNTPEKVDYFNKLCAEYVKNTKDSVLPMFLAIKDSRHCDRHDDALNRLEILSAHTDLWDNSQARLFCEYSRSFSAEMLINLAISAFNHTNLFAASTEDLHRLCSLFADIDLEGCFDLSFLGYAEELCEFMYTTKNDNSLSAHFALKTQNLFNTNDNPPLQLDRDRRLWRNVFGCMTAETTDEKSKFALDTVKLSKEEPFNICYLFYTAKLLMISSQFTMAKPYCFLTSDIIDCIFKHIVQTDTTKILLQYQALSAYWTGSFDTALFYCKKAVNHLSDVQSKVNAPCALSKFRVLISHIENEKALFSSASCQHAPNEPCVYSKVESPLYNVASRMKYIDSIPGKIMDELIKTKKIDTQKIAKAVNSLCAADRHLPEAAYMAAYFYRFTGHPEQAEDAIKDYCIKMRFSFPENPFDKNDERNETHKVFYSQIKKETVDFIANMLNVSIFTYEESTDNKPEENDYGTIIDYY